MLDFVVLRRRTTHGEGRRLCLVFGSHVSRMRPESGQKRILSGLITEEIPGQKQKETVPLEGLEPMSADGIDSSYSAGSPPQRVTSPAPYLRTASSAPGTPR